MHSGPAPLVVGIGASAGGLEAFKVLLAALPPDTSMTLVLAQHRDPRFESPLADLLQRATKLPVVDVDDGCALAPGTIYVLPPDRDLTLREGRVALVEAPDHGLRLPIDRLFRVLADAFGAQAVGVVLSGHGADGSAGLRELKAAGGLAIAQDPASAEQPEMPQRAIDTGLVDLVLALPEIPAALERFALLDAPPAPAASGEPPSPPIGEGTLRRIASVLHGHLDIDLRAYKPGTLARRIRRRIALAGLDNVDAYVTHLRAEPAEAKRLARDLLISVTSFFRDPDAFQSLRAQVIEPLVADAARETRVRVWVAGCATGEEAYSLGIELLEALATRADDGVGLQIFATDVSEEALAVARAGIYPSTIVERVGERRLAAFFTPVPGGYKVAPHLRDCVSFAVHDLTKDPPFSQIDVVSCRNVLIYLSHEAQRRVLESLHFALAPHGHLVLSPSETIGPVRGLFHTVSKPSRIYRKQGSSRPLLHQRARRLRQASGAPRVSVTPAPEPSSGRETACRALLRAWAPPTVVVGADDRVHFMHGELDPYLRFPEGEPRFEFRALIRPELAARARGALHRCRQSRASVEVTSSPDLNGPPVRLIARPAPELGEGSVLLTFVAIDGVEPAIESDHDPEHEALVDQLERELRATRDDLANTIEELEAANEALRASNEESISVNEELQSTNEELEATSEELRSLNEELTTVNAQLREKIELVEEAHDALSNFVASTKIATIFLDMEMRLRRLTPAASELLGLDDDDLGRRLASIPGELCGGGLIDDTRQVLRLLAPRTAELQTADGRWFERKVLPYRTQSEQIQGVVVTFDEVTALRAANEELAAQNLRLDLAWEAARGGVYEHAVPLDATSYISERWAAILGYRRDELPPHDRFMGWLLDQVHPEDRELVEGAYEDFLCGRARRCETQGRVRHRRGEWVWVRGSARATERNPDGSLRRVLGLMIDITELKAAEDAAHERERLREIADGLPLIVWIRDELGAIEVVNEAWHAFFGTTPEDRLDAAWWSTRVHPEDYQRHRAEVARAMRDHRAFRAELRVRGASEAWRWFESTAHPRWGADGSFRGFLGVSVDITDRRETEAALRESEARLRALADNIAQLTWMAEQSGATFWYSRRWQDYTGLPAELLGPWGWKALVHPDEVERVMDGFNASLASRTAWEDTFRLRSADGVYRWFLAQAVPFHDKEGDGLRWFGSATDISEQRKTEQQLRELLTLSNNFSELQSAHAAARAAQEAAERASTARLAFLASMSHELRTPLAGMVGLLDLVDGDPGLSPRTATALDRLRELLATQRRLIEDLLDLSRIDSGALTLNAERFPVTRLLEGVREQMLERRRGEVAIAIEAPPADLSFVGDPLRLRQILDNLASNAVKYTDAGTVRVRVSVLEPSILEILVEDTGVGIAEEDLAAAFDLFARVGPRQDAPGTGLGLAIVKGLVEQMGGTIDVRSVPDEGSRFRVRVPGAAEPARATSLSSAEAEADLRGRKILLVEDNEVIRLVVGELLAQDGVELFEATDAATASQVLAEARFDAILMDIGLPDRSGLSVIRELRISERGQARTPVIALTAYAYDEDVARSLDAGADLHLSKPVQHASLRSALSRLLSERSSEATESRPY